MKIICVDNYARENVADRLVAGNIYSRQEAECMLSALNATAGDSDYYVIRDDDYKLWRGIEELV